MKISSNSIAWLLLAATAFCVGMYVGDDKTVTHLKERLAQQNVPNRVSVPERRFGAASVSFNERSLTNNSPPSNLPRDRQRASLLHRAGITGDDIRRTLDIQKRQSDGSFVLANEPPVLRKLRSYSQAREAATVAAANEPDYTRIFSTFGLETSESLNLRAHIERIHFASLEAEEAIAQVLYARGEYDSRLKQLLSEDHYRAYRNYEAEKPILREVESFAITLPDPLAIKFRADYGSAFAAFVRQRGATDPGSWHGPYDPLPQVRQGIDEVADWATLELQAARARLDSVDNWSAAVSLPESISSKLRHYYERDVEQKALSISNLFRFPSPGNQSLPVALEGITPLNPIAE